MRILAICLLALLTGLFLPPQPVTAGKASPVDKRFALGRAYMNNLLFSSQATDRQWQRCAATFLALRRTKLADRALFLAGRAVERQADMSDSRRKLDEAATLYRELAKRFPHSNLADDALFRLGDLTFKKKKELRQAAKIFARIVVLHPDGDMAVHARKRLAEIRSRQHPATTAGDNVRVVDIRFGSTAYYSRVVIEATATVTYESNLLPAAADRPKRLYLDLRDTTLPRSLAGRLLINDGLLQQVRSAQHTPDTVRVVLDTLSFSDYKITTRQDPFRIIVDVWGEGKGKKKLRDKTCSVEPPSIARQLGLGVRRIILDPGHGGHDPGAINRYGMREKDITLAVAKRIGAELRRSGKYEVHLTRTCDEYLALEERTEIANRLQGDIFVSLHVNSAESAQLAGIETYYLSLAGSAEEMRAAATENAASSSSLNDLQAILLDLMMNSKINESARLAEAVQDRMVTGLGRRYEDIRNLGVKKAPFIVLIGAKMPSILTEIAFLSNPREARRLKDEGYLTAVAHQIAAGIDTYVEHLAGGQRRPPSFRQAAVQD